MQHFEGNQGGVCVHFHIFVVCLKSCRTAWACALPRAVPVVLQPCNTDLLCSPRDMLCASYDGRHASPASALRRRWRFLFPLNNTNTPCVVLKEDRLSWSAAGCVPQLLRAPEGWASGMGMRGLQTGTFLGPSRTSVGWGTFLNATTLGNFWGQTTSVLLSHPPRRSRQGAGVRVNGSVVLAKPHGPWGTALLLTTSWDL